MSEEPHTNMWELGQCSSSHSYDKIGTYIERCCTPPVEHTLICRSSENTNWHDKLLKINGHAFCDDFAGYKAIRMIRVQGILDEIRWINVIPAYIYNLYQTISNHYTSKLHFLK